MKLISRANNVVNLEDDLEVLNILENYPVFMGCVEHNVDEDIHADMTWAISKTTGILQLTNLIPLEILYESDHDSGVIGDIWLDHHKHFAEFISDFNPKVLLEIGGAHGILSREYLKKNQAEWIILEPNPSPAEGVRAKFIKGFFDDKFIFNDKVDTIVHSHVLEHIYYPDEFTSHISNFLEEGQNLIFSIPNMEEMLKKNYTNCLNFEHTIFLTEPYIDYFLTKHGFKQVAKKYFREDHSIFYAFKKLNNTYLAELPANLYDHNKMLYLNYLNYHHDLIFKLNTKILNTKKNQAIYLFGAHVFAQSLIQFGLNTNRIKNLLDNDQKKQDKRLYGTNLTVKSPHILTSEDRPIIILKAGIYNNEIIEDILTNINPNTIFWD